MTEYRSHHPKSSTQRLYLPRHEGGKGLINIKQVHEKTTLFTYLKIKASNDPMLKMVAKHENTGVGAFLKNKAEQITKKYEIVEETNEAKDTQSINKAMSILKSKMQETLMKQHQAKPLHGKYYKHLQDNIISKKYTFAFLKSASLKSETEDFILAAQDGVLATMVYKQKIMGVPIENLNCRACGEKPETTFHILSNCPKYAKQLYINRHDAALKEIYSHLKFEMGFDEKKFRVTP